MARISRGRSERIRTLVRVLLCALLMFPWLPERAHAAEGEGEIPDALVPWIPWVRAELGEQVCPRAGEQIHCTWPAVVDLAVEPAGGSFRLTVTADARAQRGIVGDLGAWPRAVEVDGKTVPVLDKEGVPTVLVEPGTHVISGKFSWNSPPETLFIGHDVALVRLEVGGDSVPLVRREDGKIWLRTEDVTGVDTEEPENVELSVFRRFVDGTPLTAETRLVFQVSGRPRELSLEHPLTPGMLPLSLSSDLASALSAEGQLRVQLLPGRHELTLHARQLDAGAKLRNRERRAPWPEREVWTFVPDANLRAVDLIGLPSVDASRTDLPPDWRDGGAYLAAPDAEWTLKTTRRGQEQVPDNRIRLERDLWLDEQAGGFTVVDHLRGEMHQTFRLDLLEGDLGAVKLSGIPQVLTRNGDASGVEIRETQLDLEAVSRLERRRLLPAVAWSEEAEQLSARLHLPPGWSLLFARGVDQASSTWISRWDLFDVFHLLLVALAVWRLAGVPAGMVAGFALLLSRGENDAPEYVWLPLLALLALVPRLSPGRLRSALSFLSRGLLVLVAAALLTFSVDQVRQALFPHLGYGSNVSSDFRSVVEEAVLEDGIEEKAASPQDVQQAEVQQQVEAPPPAPVGGGLALAPGRTSKGDYPATLARRGSFSDAPLTSSSSASQQKQFDVDAIVQTGPGIPQSPGELIQLSWSGPVAQDHQIGLVLVSPHLARVITALRLLSLWGLLWLCFRLGRGPGLLKRGGTGGSWTAAVTACALLLWPTPSSAEQPTDARLEQLKERLLRPAACSPHCQTVSALSIEAGDTLHLEATVHSGAPSIYRLPGPLTMLAAAKVTLDGKPITAARLGDDGHLWLRLDPGVFRVEVEGTPVRDRFTLDLGDLPKHVTVTADGWEFSGVDPRGIVADGTVTLQRQVEQRETDSSRGEKTAQISVPAFFTVERRIVLGVSNHVITTVRRLSDPSSPEVLLLPLLPGEQPTSGDFDVREGVAHVAFSRETTVRDVISTLQLPAASDVVDLRLLAPPQTERTETWLIDCGVVFHCTTAGLPASEQTEQGRAVTTFRPFPGEALTLHATRPPVAEGRSVTIHEATLDLSPGMRGSQAKLSLSVESSRPSSHDILIPKGAKLSGVRVAGERQSVQASDGRVSISLPSGRSPVEIEWRDQAGIRTLFRTPHVDVGTLGVNFRTTIELPESRWLLFAWGPNQGPALLFWGYLLLIVLAALVLPRLPYAPLRAPEWLLLGLGLTQIPPAVALFIAGWFFAVGSRKAWPSLNPTRHNLLQLVLIFYSLFFLLALAAAVYGGLVSSPDMEIEGAGSHAGRLVWYQDRSGGLLPSAGILSVSLWLWRAFMLLWALWLARTLLLWLRWAWAALGEGGYWKKRPQIPHKSSAETRPEAADPPSNSPPGAPAADDPEEHR